ncbi:MAG: methionine adenosyltransferase [Eubacterium sp.]|nr:methionine adenosyltransferase [Eubacterium sp.]
MGKYYLLTSESVTEGHPDKLCDIVSDTLLDAYLSEDPASHVAMETVASKNTIFLSGEVTSSARPDLVKKVREAVLEIGYDSAKKGLDGRNCLVLTNVISQSPDIAQGVNQTDGKIGAGDQGMMYGYACDETEEYMPLSISLAHKLTKRLTYVRKAGILPYLYPDGKSQVTVAYDKDGEIAGIQTVVISAQHSADVSVEKLRADVKREVIDAVIDKKDMLPDIKIHINPTGRFVVGGPEGDTGLTGRKIIVDTYGGIARHGGGAFSGKDPTKVDRSAAYMARYAAVNVVAAGLCRKCEVNLAYAIGVPDPVSVKIDTFGSEEIPKEIIEKAVEEVFDFSVAGIINNLSLTSVTYKPLAAYGHFGRPELDLPWERTDKVADLQKKAISYIAEAIIDPS